MSGGWGPFRADLDPAERLARLRSLRALVRVLTGPPGKSVAIALRRAEIVGHHPDILAAAEAEFDRLGSLDRRRILSSFAELHAPVLEVIHD